MVAVDGSGPLGGEPRANAACLGGAVAAIVCPSPPLENGLRADPFLWPGESELSSVFSNAASFEAAVRDVLPPELKNIPLRVDTARHVHRPGTRGRSRPELPLRSVDRKNPQS